MIYFFQKHKTIYSCQTGKELLQEDIDKLCWLFGDATLLQENSIYGTFIGPRANLVTPWSTNAVEISQNMMIDGLKRIEEFTVFEGQEFDPMLKLRYEELYQDMFEVKITPEPVKEIKDINTFNEVEGLALSEEEILYLNDLSQRIGRPLTDSEVFGFSQINSEHCRHKIFNGQFILDGIEQKETLFQMIKTTSKVNPNDIVSAYKDNVAFIKGPKAQQFAPKDPTGPSYYDTSDFKSVLSLKAETHNFPTTVEPFNGAATGSGGEIRDRLAGGQGAIPLAGTAVYMTSYSRLNEERPWEKGMEARAWLYQTPMDILIKASNGASDFGNKFGQPLIAGSLLTFEQKEAKRLLGFDKVIMLAGGVGYGKLDQSIKQHPKAGEKIVVMGGDNYRIGMGGAAVSSADTGAFGSGIELNAIQRSNPEMQKRVANAVRGMIEMKDNPIVSIHDHGAGGHLNCLSELVEETGGFIDMDKLPIGDKTLSSKEIIGNESQERMGLVIGEEGFELLKKVAERERSPIYAVGKVTNDYQFTFHSKMRSEKPMDLSLLDMFGSSPKTIMQDNTVLTSYPDLDYNEDITYYLKNVLRLEAVSCKDWLTNKVDRCVGGLVAKQQCCGPLQLPLNNCGVMSLDYRNNQGVATSIGHAPISALIDPSAGSRLAIAEALTNIVWAPLENLLASVSLSANWMWPCKYPGEDVRLYKAVKSVSDYAIGLGINVPTGKDSLSMAQKYKDKTVLSPGTVIISAAGHCNDITQVVEPVFKPDTYSDVYYISLADDQFSLGGSSLAQTLNKIGNQCPDVKSASEVKEIFNGLQQAIKYGYIISGHDVSSGGLVTTLLEMCFSSNNIGANIDLCDLGQKDDVKVLFSEQPAVIIQASSKVETLFEKQNISFVKIGHVVESGKLIVKNLNTYSLDIDTYRDIWYETSYLLDRKQCSNGMAKERFRNYKNQELTYQFPIGFDGILPEIHIKRRPQAAIIREKGSNSEREMANAMYRAGFEVKDIHMTDLITGRTDLSEVRFLGAVGGFSNSDVLGSAKGWAGAFLFNPKAKKALTDFFARQDTLSLGICNGCQLFLELDLLNPEDDVRPKMTHNTSMKHESGFTSVEILKNNSVMLEGLEGARLGVWISHGEGKFNLPKRESHYNIVAKYGYNGYPANPNGSDYNTAMMASKDGRHLATMPHIERSFYPWNWPYYPNGRNDQVSPWYLAFKSACDWVLK
jgi:phosphoribosylformylglycinamidine synthase